MTDKETPNQFIWKILDVEALIIHKLCSMKCTAQNDLHQQYCSKLAVILIESKFIDYMCFHMEVVTT